MYTSSITPVLLHCVVCAGLLLSHGHTTLVFVEVEGSSDEVASIFVQIAQEEPLRDGVASAAPYALHRSALPKEANGALQHFQVLFLSFVQVLADAAASDACVHFAS